MGGGLVDVESRTSVVLIGKTGNGKSATANSIIGRRSFTSRASSSGVTTCCELQTTVLQNGLPVNVIDTPGIIYLNFLFHVHVLQSLFFQGYLISLVIHKKWREK